MTATCPVPVPVIDRSFAEQPPACMMEYQDGFLFPSDEPWGVQGIEATKQITANERCLIESRDWVISEIRARTK